MDVSQYREPRGADSVTACPLKMQTSKSFAKGAGLGNTVQQQTEWKEAKVISSQSNAREEETQALKVSAVLLRGLPRQESRPPPLPFAERTSLLG